MAHHKLRIRAQSLASFRMTIQNSYRRKRKNSRRIFMADTEKFFGDFGGQFRSSILDCMYEYKKTIRKNPWRLTKYLIVGVDGITKFVFHKMTATALSCQSLLLHKKLRITYTQLQAMASTETPNCSRCISSFHNRTVCSCYSCEVNICQRDKANHELQLSLSRIFKRLVNYRYI